MIGYDLDSIRIEYFSYRVKNTWIENQQRQTTNTNVKCNKILIIHKTIWNKEYLNEEQFEEKQCIRYEYKKNMSHILECLEFPGGYPDRYTPDEAWRGSTAKILW